MLKVSSDIATGLGMLISCIEVPLGLNTKCCSQYNTTQNSPPLTTICSMAHFTQLNIAISHKNLIPESAKIHEGFVNTLWILMLSHIMDTLRNGDTLKNVEIIKLDKCFRLTFCCLHCCSWARSWFPVSLIAITR